MPMHCRRALLRGGPRPAVDLRTVSLLGPVTLGLRARSMAAFAGLLQRGDIGIEVEALYAVALWEAF